MKTLLTTTSIILTLLFLPGAFTALTVIALWKTFNFRGKHQQMN